MESHENRTRTPSPMNERKKKQTNHPFPTLIKSNHCQQTLQILTVHVEIDPFADGGRHLVGCDAQVGTHLSSIYV